MENMLRIMKEQRRKNLGPDEGEDLKVCQIGRQRCNPRVGQQQCKTLTRYGFAAREC